MVEPDGHDVLRQGIALFFQFVPVCDLGRGEIARRGQRRVEIPPPADRHRKLHRPLACVGVIAELVEQEDALVDLSLPLERVGLFIAGALRLLRRVGIGAECVKVRGRLVPGAVFQLLFRQAVARLGIALGCAGGVAERGIKRRGLAPLARFHAGGRFGKAAAGFERCAQLLVFDPRGQGGGAGGVAARKRLFDPFRKAFRRGSGKRKRGREQQRKRKR